VTNTIGFPSKTGMRQGAGFNEKDRACVMQAGPNFFFCDHGIPPTTGNGLVGEYTILIDMTVVEVFHGVIQFDIQNIANPYVQFRGRNFAIRVNTDLAQLPLGWVCLVVTLKAPNEYYRAYMNGTKIIEGTEAWRDNCKLHPNGVFFMGHQDVQDRGKEISVSSIAIFDRALTEEEIVSLGGI